MWARKRIDIGWSDLAWGFLGALLPGSHREAQRRAEGAWLDSERCLACLSVRSGWDLMLSQLALPRGSEVLVSAVTIQDMVSILEHHGLVPVPIDIDPKLLVPQLDQIDRAITTRTKALLITHLFGAQIDLQPFANKAHEHGLLLWEDCAQAFDGISTGHPSADAVMFSFGPIKTATALGGGLFRVRDARLVSRMRAAQEAWPIRSRSSFLLRLAQYALLKLLSGRVLFAMCMAWMRWRDRDPDEVLNSAVRNFPGDALLAQIRHRAPIGMLRLMARRLERRPVERIRIRARLGRQLANRLRSVREFPGSAVPSHSFWVFPVHCRDCETVVTRLRRAGFDATMKSQLRAICSADEIGLPNAVRIVSESLFLPFYPEMPESELERLAALLVDQGSVVETVRIGAKPPYSAQASA